MIMIVHWLEVSHKISQISSFIKFRLQILSNHNGHVSIFKQQHFPFVCFELQLWVLTNFQKNSPINIDWISGSSGFFMSRNGRTKKNAAPCMVLHLWCTIRIHNQQMNTQSFALLVYYIKINRYQSLNPILSDFFKSTSTSRHLYREKNNFKPKILW